MGASGVYIRALYSAGTGNSRQKAPVPGVFEGQSPLGSLLRGQPGKPMDVAVRLSVCVTAV